MEDAYVISEKLAKSTTTSTVKEISIIIPPETKILKIEEDVGKFTNLNEPLVEFVYEEDLENYIQAYEVDTAGEEGEAILTSSSDIISLKSPGGNIVDIKVYINDKAKSDSKLIALHRKLVDRVNDIKTKLEANHKTAAERVSASENLDLSFVPIGGHKQKGVEFKGIKISYLIKQPKELRTGDKISNRYGAKGLIGKIVSNKTTGSYSGDIDLFISPVSVFGRKNIAFIKELYLGKLTKALNEKVHKMIDREDKTEDIYKIILGYYKALSSPTVYKSIENKLTGLKAAEFRNLIRNGDMTLFTIIEPFTNISFESIKMVAKMLNVELDEYITIEQDDGTKITTDVKVAVGVTYVQCLEHYSSAYASVGGAAKYSAITKQPMKIGSGQNVGTIGSLDIHALVGYGANDILKELLTARSDHHKLKRDMYMDIIENGKLTDINDENITIGGTTELKNLYLTSLGLNVK